MAGQTANPSGHEIPHGHYARLVIVTACAPVHLLEQGRARPARPAWAARPAWLSRNTVHGPLRFKQQQLRDIATNRAA